MDFYGPSKDRIPAEYLVIVTEDGEIMFEIQNGYIYLPNLWIKTLWKKYIMFNQESVACFENICEREGWTIVEMVRKEEVTVKPPQVYDVVIIDDLASIKEAMIYEIYKKTLKLLEEQEKEEKSKLEPPAPSYFLEWGKDFIEAPKDKYKAKSVFESNWHKKKFKYGE